MQTPREAPLRAAVWTLIEWEPSGAWFPWPWMRSARSRLECGHTVDGTRCKMPKPCYRHTRHTKEAPDARD